jgi:hypothetical protein
MFNSEELFNDITELFSDIRYVPSKALSVIYRDEDRFSTLKAGADRSADGKRYRAKLKLDPARTELEKARRKKKRLEKRLEKTGGVS